jgi:hypothetical protein
MAISRKIERKAPTQHPKAFYHCEQQGGKHGIATHVPEKLGEGKMGTTGAPIREHIMGRKDLEKE